MVKELRTACTKQRLKVYCGFSPTAESLHLQLGIIVLSWFQRCGHVSVALLGGATAKVGALMTEEERENVAEPEEGMNYTEFTYHFLCTTVCISSRRKG